MTGHIQAATDNFSFLDNTLAKCTQGRRRAELPPALTEPLGMVVKPDVQCASGFKLRLEIDKLLQVQRQIAASKSKRLCGLVPVDSNDVLWTSRGFAGVLRCGSSLCAHCGHRKAYERSELLYKAMKEDNSSDYFMMTLTIATAGTIADQVQALKSSMSRFVTNNRQFWKRRGASTSLARGYDITFNPGSQKVHLHIHAVMMLSKGFSEDEVAERCWQSWRQINEKQGRTVVKTAFYCKRVTHIRTSSLYLNKSIGYEVMAGAGKKAFNGSYSLNGLLKYIQMTGCRRSIRLYRQFEAATTGLRWVSIGRHFKEIARSTDDMEEGNQDVLYDDGDIGVPADPPDCDKLQQTHDSFHGIQQGYRFRHIQVRRDIHLEMVKAGRSSMVLGILLNGDSEQVEWLRELTVILNFKFSQTSPDTPSQLQYFWSNWKGFEADRRLH